MAFRKQNVGTRTHGTRKSQGTSLQNMIDSARQQARNTQQPLAKVYQAWSQANNTKNPIDIKHYQYIKQEYKNSHNIDETTFQNWIQIEHLTNLKLKGEC